ncbi:hypothetical protein V1525DRAFT_393915 [Lipomyces kononenkoae]|uniref:Uncharacterized protein n=1 Tax=Lipomyces kononenkoae TaxID=34357 RepID=A0ACC3TAI9_LIPKO
MSKLHQTQQRFYSNFQSAKKELDKLLAAGANSSPTSDILDAIDQKLAALIEDVQIAKAYLVPYDQRAYASQVDQLTKEFNELKERAVPISKFAFSTRSRRLPGDGRSSEPEQIASKQINSSPQAFDIPGITIHQLQGLENKFVTVEPLPASGSLSISEISNCIIFVPPSASVMSSVRVTDCLKSILVFSGEISGPLHLSRVITSTIVVRQAHQLRLHESSDSDIILGETGGRIIEKCSDLIFAKAEFNEAHDRITISQFTESIDDFDHPAGKSPNWSTIDDETTTKFTDNHYERIVHLSQTTNEQHIQENLTRLIHAALSRDIDFEDGDESKHGN